MSWQSWSEFWSMGGYGFYVWGSYAVTLVLIAAEIARVRARRSAAFNSAKRLRAPQGASR
jgi:heme exporter protein D